MTDKRVPHPYACEECGRTFLGLAALQAHRCDKHVLSDADLRALVQQLRGKATGQNVGISTHLFDVAASELESLLVRAESAEEQVRHLERRIRDLTEEKNCAVLDKREVEAERDSLKAALRDEVISCELDFDSRCRLCGARWPNPKDEHHAEGCLAALEDTT